MKATTSVSFRSIDGRVLAECEACPANIVCKTGNATQPIGPMLIDRLTVVTVEAGTGLAIEGEIDAYAVFVAEGVARVFTSLPDGRRQILRFLFPGNFHLPNPDEPSAVSIEAVVAMTICKIRVDEAGTCETGATPLLQILRQDRLDQLQAAQRHMLLLGRKSAQEKVASFLVDMANVPAVRTNDVNVVKLPMSRQDIADYLGLTPETVSREFSHLRTSGLIEVDGSHHVVLLEPEGLESLAASDS